MPKIVVGLTWLWGIVSFFVAPESTVSSVGQVVFWLLTVAHAVECVVFLPKLKNAGGSLGNHLVQTFIFGILHVQGLKAESSPEAAAGG